MQISSSSDLVLYYYEERDEKNNVIVLRYNSTDSDDCKSIHVDLTAGYIIIAKCGSGHLLFSPLYV